MKKIYGWTVALVLLGFVLAGIFLTVAPDQIPAHYDIRGQVDRWGSKYEFVLFPFINLVFGGIMALIAWFEGRKGREMNEKVVNILNIWILAVFNVLWIFFMWKAVDLDSPGSGIVQLPTKILLMILNGSFIPVGNLMPKSQRNGVFGLRTKWSMADDWCWQQSQRFGGFAMVICGILGVIASALPSEFWAGCATLGLIAAMTTAGVYASYRVYMRSQNM